MSRFRIKMIYLISNVFLASPKINQLLVIAVIPLLWAQMTNSHEKIETCEIFATFSPITVISKDKHYVFPLFTNKRECCHKNPSENIEQKRYSSLLIFFISNFEFHHNEKEMCIFLVSQDHKCSIELLLS